MFVVIAAIVGGLFAWFSPKPSGVTASVSGSNNQGPLTVTGAARDITINYNVPASETKDAIAALEEKLKGTSSAIELTRGEVKLLARALTDLDQRTSGITKLPDGRTAMGGFVGGEPRIVIEEHEAAVQAVNKKDYVTALEHSKKAIEAYEEAAKLPRAASTGDLLPEARGKVYYLGALMAGTDRQFDTALNWIRKADASDPKPEYKAYQVAVLSDSGKREEAKALLEESLKAAPDNPVLIDVKKQTGL